MNLEPVTIVRQTQSRWRRCNRLDHELAQNDCAISSYRTPTKKSKLIIILLNRKNYNLYTWYKLGFVILYNVN